MRKIIYLICVLLLAGTLVSAQEFGSIKGTAKDTDGEPLPGITVTLTGNYIPPMATVTSPNGNFRFLKLPVADDYVLRFELSGFKTFIRKELVVLFGRDVHLDITMEQAVIDEEVIVIGESPVIDTKRTQVGVNITEQQIMSLPTARNPWGMLQMEP